MRGGETLKTRPIPSTILPANLPSSSNGKCPRLGGQHNGSAMDHCRHPPINHGFPYMPIDGSDSAGDCHAPFRIRLEHILDAITFARFGLIPSVGMCMDYPRGTDHQFANTNRIVQVTGHHRPSIHLRLRNDWSIQGHWTF